ncbi:MAG: electron transfer flavoprotein subunit alpha/FixB family protein [Candidatus Krumholzibacteriota bacterium]|nr:electron transfer flavoprotein subunit alpha/FixB family protein [Candidatus Krumholzibacteriota bacterium]
MANDVLIFGEMRNGELKRVALELIAAGRTIADGLGGAVDALLVGKGAAAAAESLGLYGLRRVHVCENEALAGYSTEGYATVLAGLVAEGGYGHVLLGATAMGRDLAPRAAARTDGVVFGDCVEVRFEDGLCVARRPVYAGKLLVELVRTGGHPVYLTIRPNNIPPAEATGTPGEIVAREPGVTREAIRAIATAIVPLAGGRPDVTEADVIVSGGRAMKDPENFRILEKLADLLGGAVGASRAAVDAGYAPQPLQVGQTGKVVNPKLYIACGISGAIQHLAGMRTSKTIVAINKDASAPIFEKAHYGIVGDLFDVVPLLTEEIRKIL